MFIYRFIYLAVLGLRYSIWVFVLFCFLVAAHGIFTCGMCSLAPRPGMEARIPALGAQSLSHSTTREVPILEYFNHTFSFMFCGLNSIDLDFLF